MNEQLLLENIRSMLARLEETILFAFIERAQFRQNMATYDATRHDVAVPLDGQSLVGYFLRETEKLHARLRRYTSPDEHPFFPDLPAPLLPELRFDENPLAPNDVNLNARVRTVYERSMVPLICREGDDSQYGSSALCDIACLQALSRRVHYGKFVAECKYRATPAVFRPLIDVQDATALMDRITDPDVEDGVLQRVRLKAETHGYGAAGRAMGGMIDVDAVVEIYRRWIIPLNKAVQVEYLLQRR